MKILMSRMVAGERVESWVEVPDPVEESVDELPISPRQFEWLLAFTGLDEVWASMEAEAKETDRTLYANLRAQRAASGFLLDVTLAFVAEVRDMAAELHPDVDLSDDAIRAAWEQAASQTFEALLPE